MLFAALVSFLAHDCVRCAAKIQDAIGLTMDEELREGRIGTQRLTRLRHWLCVAAMVSKPVSGFTKALV